jgi:hypothetical protein
VTNSAVSRKSTASAMSRISPIHPTGCAASSSSLSICQTPPGALHHTARDGVLHDVLRPFSAEEATGNPAVRTRQAMVSGRIACFRSRRAGYGSTSRTSSNSIGIPSGRLATPTTIRPDNFAGPNTCNRISDAPSATLGCSRKSPSVAMNTPSLATPVTLSRDPRKAFAAESALKEAVAAAFRPSSTVNSPPTLRQLSR